MAKGIDSVSNPLVKRLVRLRERRARDSEGVALVEGAREVARALAGGWRPVLRVTCDAFAAGQQASTAEADSGGWAGVEHVAMSRAAFTKVSARQNPDGVLALFEPPQRTLADLPWPPDGLYLVLSRLEKPGNLGALLRSADAANATAVLVCGSGTDLLNPQVVRASMGSLFSRPVLAVDDDALRAAFTAHGVQVVATTPHADTTLWDADLRGPVAILLGAEDRGLDEHWLTAANQRVRVPMAGAADSLNVSVTGALLLFEALRQRRSPPWDNRS